MAVLGRSVYLLLSERSAELMGMLFGDEPLLSSTSRVDVSHTATRLEQYGLVRTGRYFLPEFLNIDGR